LAVKPQLTSTISECCLADIWSRVKLTLHVHHVWLSYGYCLVHNWWWYIPTQLAQSGFTMATVW